MVMASAESSEGVPYWTDAPVGASRSGEEGKLTQHLLQRTIGGDGGNGEGEDTTALTGTAIDTHPLGHSAGDVGEESRATVLNARDGWSAIPIAEGVILVHQNAGGRTSVHVVRGAGTYVTRVHVAPGGETHVYVAAEGASGGSHTQPLLQSSYSLGILGTTDAVPQNMGSEYGEAGLWKMAVTDALPTGDKESLYMEEGALTDAHPYADVDAPAHVIDMPPKAPAADPAEEESRDAITGTTDQARKHLGKLLFTLLPACVIALGPLSGAPDYVKLATYIILTLLIVLLVAGMSSRACAKHILRLTTCAGIFAMTIFVSTQFSQGTHIFIAACVGVALTRITWAL